MATVSDSDTWHAAEVGLSINTQCRDPLRCGMCGCCYLCVQPDHPLAQYNENMFQMPRTPGPST